jgi:hypothetical protein
MDPSALVEFLFHNFHFINYLFKIRSFSEIHMETLMNQIHQTL